MHTQFLGEGGLDAVCGVFDQLLQLTDAQQANVHTLGLLPCIKVLGYCIRAATERQGIQRQFSTVSANLVNQVDFAQLLDNLLEIVKNGSKELQVYAIYTLSSIVHNNAQLAGAPSLGACQWEDFLCSDSEPMRMAVRDLLLSLAKWQPNVVFERTIKAVQTAISAGDTTNCVQALTVLRQVCVETPSEALQSQVLEMLACGLRHFETQANIPNASGLRGNPSQEWFSLAAVLPSDAIELVWHQLYETGYVMDQAACEFAADSLLKIADHGGLSPLVDKLGVLHAAALQECGELQSWFVEDLSAKASNVGLKNQRASTCYQNAALQQASNAE